MRTSIPVLGIEVLFLSCAGACDSSAFGYHIDAGWIQNNTDRSAAPLACPFYPSAHRRFSADQKQLFSDMPSYHPEAAMCVRTHCFPALVGFFIKSPCKPHGIVSKDRAAFGRSHSNTCFLSLCKLCANMFVCVNSLLIIIVLLTD